MPSVPWLTTSPVKPPRARTAALLVISSAPLPLGTLPLPPAPVPTQLLARMLPVVVLPSAWMP
jgi:hypothetical protein